MNILATMQPHESFTQQNPKGGERSFIWEKERVPNY